MTHGAYEARCPHLHPDQRMYGAGRTRTSTPYGDSGVTARCLRRSATASRGTHLQLYQLSRFVPVRFVLLSGVCVSVRLDPQKHSAEVWHSDIRSEVSRCIAPFHECRPCFHVFSQENIGHRLPLLCCKQNLVVSVSHDTTSGSGTLRIQRSQTSLSVSSS